MEEEIIKIELIQEYRFNCPYCSKLYIMEKDEISDWASKIGGEAILCGDCDKTFFVETDPYCMN